MDITEKISTHYEDGGSNGILKTIINWLILFRIPNFFTLPGDIIVGYIIAEATLNNSSYLLGYSFKSGRFISFSIFYLIFAIFAVYGVGLITNDLADAEEDSKTRPERPIPSGAVTQLSAWSMVLFLSVAALVFAKLASNRSLELLAALLVIIFLYNYFLKKSPLAGPFTLGLCRSFAVIIGFFGCWYSPGYYPPMFYIVTLTWFLFFFGISLVAYYETDNNPPVRGRFILLFIPILWGSAAIFASQSLAVIIFIQEIPPGIFLAIAAVVVFTILIIKNFITLNRRSVTPAKKQKSVGELIRAIIFLQVSATSFLGYPFVALFLFLSYIPATFAARKFYSS